MYEKNLPAKISIHITPRADTPRQVRWLFHLSLNGTFQQRGRRQGVDIQLAGEGTSVGASHGWPTWQIRVT
jgi:hypothetical protein